MPQASTGKGTPTTQARDWHRVKRTLREETEKIHATVEVSEGELAVGGDVLEVKTNDRKNAARLVPSPTTWIHTETIQCRLPLTMSASSS